MTGKGVQLYELKEHEREFIQTLKKELKEKEIKYWIEKEKLLKNVDKKIPLILNTIEYHKNTLIRLEDLGYTYDDKNYVFKNINLELEKGDRLVIRGKNGSRKIYINKYNIRKFNKLCRKYSKT